MEATVTIKATPSDFRLLRAAVEHRISHLSQLAKDVHGQARYELDQERVQLGKILLSL